MHERECVCAFVACVFETCDEGEGRREGKKGEEGRELPCQFSLTLREGVEEEEEEERDVFSLSCVTCWGPLPTCHLWKYQPNRLVRRRERREEKRRVVACDDGDDGKRWEGIE